MSYQSSIILTYKGKILLFSRDILIETSEKNSWDFLQMGKQKSKDIIDFLKKEISVSSGSKLDSQKLTSISTENSSSQLFHFKLTDENVNGIKRKDGWRLEFYRFNEIEKISLSEEARNIFTQYNEQIKELVVG